jgi:hypothetical protein
VAPLTTSNKDFRVKNGLVVEGTTATVNNSNILTETSSINDLADVDISGAQDGYALVYNTTSQSWTAQEVEGGGGSENYDSIKDISSQTGTTYTLALTDANDLIKADNSIGITITVPKNSSVEFSTKTEIHIVQYGTGQVTFEPVDGDVTLRSTPGLKTRNQWSMVTLIKIDTNEWILTGDLTE